MPDTNIEFEYPEELARISKEQGTCPPETVFETEIKAYRWVLSPIEHDLNFLPNLIYNRQKNADKSPKRRVTPIRNECGMLGQSYLDSLGKAISMWNEFTTELQAKLGYTHIAEGIIYKTDGRVTSTSEEHFMLYAYKGHKLKSNFKIVSPIKQ